MMTWSEHYYLFNNKYTERAQKENYKYIITFVPGVPRILTHFLCIDLATPRGPHSSYSLQSFEQPDLCMQQVTITVSQVTES